MSKALTSSLRFCLHFLISVTLLDTQFSGPASSILKQPNYTSSTDTGDETDCSISQGLKHRWKSHFSLGSARIAGS